MSSQERGPLGFRDWQDDDRHLQSVESSFLKLLELLKGRDLPHDLRPFSEPFQAFASRSFDVFVEKKDFLGLEKCLGLALEISNSLMSLSLGMDEPNLVSLELPKSLLNCCQVVLEKLLGLEGSFPAMCLKVVEFIPSLLSLVFHFCHGFVRGQDSPADEVVKGVKRFFEEGKHLLDQFGVLLDHKINLDMEDVEDQRVLMDTLKCLDKLFGILPQLEFNVYGKTAKIFLRLNRISKPGLNYQGLISAVSAATKDLATEVSAQSTRSSLQLICRKIIFSLKFLKEVLGCVPKKTDMDYTDLILLIAKVERLNEVFPFLSDGCDVSLKVPITRDLPGFANKILFDLMAFPEFSDFLLQKKVEPLSKYEYILVLSKVLAEIPNLDRDDRSAWMTNLKLNPLDKILASADDCKEFNLPPFIIGVEHGGRGEEVAGAYEYITSHIQAFIMDANAAEMVVVERVLFNSIIDFTARRSFGKRISSDIWCFIARFGPAQFCSESFRFLLRARSIQQDDALDLLIYRLSGLLSESDVKALQAEFPPSLSNQNLELWSILNFSNCDADFQEETIGIAMEIFQSFTGGQDVSLDCILPALTILKKAKPNDQLRNLLLKFMQKLSGSIFVCSENSWCVAILNATFAIMSTMLDTFSEDSVLVLLNCLQTLMSSCANEPVLAFMLKNILIRVKRVSRYESVLAKLWISIAETAVFDALLQKKLTSKEVREKLLCDVQGYDKNKNIVISQVTDSKLCDSFPSESNSDVNYIMNTYSISVSIPPQAGDVKGSFHIIKLQNVIKTAVKEVEKLKKSGSMDQATMGATNRVFTELINLKNHLQTLVNECSKN